MAIIVTGGAGFIGTNFIIDWFKESDELLINIDKLTYAGNIHNMEAYKNDKRCIFIRGDIGDQQLIRRVIKQYQPRAVINFAAESHVDRSINAPAAFIQTNIVGTFQLLEEVKQYWESLSADKKEYFRFLHVSTDEVYGALEMLDPAFTEHSQYQPNSPYSASKAASDHLVRAYHHTYGLPVLTAHSSNNYGPYQYPEKLIPRMICRAIKGKELPVYGDGKNVRDWIFVSDHCTALRLILQNGIAGETYNIGSAEEKTNLDVVHALCHILDEIYPKKNGNTYQQQIVFVKDRLGHDRRYAMDSRKIMQQLGWQPVQKFEQGMLATVKWYLSHQAWIDGVVARDDANT